MVKMLLIPSFILKVTLKTDCVPGQLNYFDMSQNSRAKGSTKHFHDT